MSDRDKSIVSAMLKARELGVKMLASDCEAILSDLHSEVGTLNERLGEHDLCSKLIDAWIAEHGGQISWGKAIEITAIVTKMEANERSRMLTLDEPNIQEELVELRKNAELFTHAMPKSDDTQPSTDVSELVQALSAAKPAIINFSDYWHDKEDRALADKYNEMLSTIDALIAKHTVK